MTQQRFDRLQQRGRMITCTLTAYCKSKLLTVLLFISEQGRHDARRKRAKQQQLSVYTRKQANHRVVFYVEQRRSKSGGRDSVRLLVAAFRRLLPVFCCLIR